MFYVFFAICYFGAKSGTKGIKFNKSVMINQRGNMSFVDIENKMKCKRVIAVVLASDCEYTDNTVFKGCMTFCFPFTRNKLYNNLGPTYKTKLQSSLLKDGTPRNDLRTT